MGCNGYRCVHNPPTPKLLDAYDCPGMTVLNENRLLSSTEDGVSKSQLEIHIELHPQRLSYILTYVFSCKKNLMN